jgi:hypothetical protein
MKGVLSGTLQSQSLSSASQLQSGEEAVHFDGLRSASSPIPFEPRLQLVNAANVPEAVLIAQSQNPPYLVEVRLVFIGDCFTELDGQVRKEHSITTAAHRYGLALEINYPAAVITL